MAEVEGDAIRDGFSYPLVIKCEYSAGSLGVSAVRSRDEFVAASMRQLTDYNQDLIVQEWCRNREFTCAVLGRGYNSHIAPLEILLDDKRMILDEQIKKTYKGLHLAVVDEPELRKRLCDIVSAFWQHSRGGDYARIDVLQDTSGNLHIIDVNLFPSLDAGPTVVSFFPQALGLNYGLSYEDGVLGIMAVALSRHSRGLTDDLMAVGVRLDDLRSS